MAFHSRNLRRPLACLGLRLGPSRDQSTQLATLCRHLSRSTQTSRPRRPCAVWRRLGLSLCDKRRHRWMGTDHSQRAIQPLPGQPSSTIAAAVVRWPRPPYNPSGVVSQRRSSTSADDALSELVGRDFVSNRLDVGVGQQPTSSCAIGLFVRHNCYSRRLPERSGPMIRIFGGSASGSRSMTATGAGERMNDVVDTDFVPKSRSVNSHSIFVSQILGSR